MQVVKGVKYKTLITLVTENLTIKRKKTCSSHLQFIPVVSAESSPDTN
jgi:hypothetical protein